MALKKYWDEFLNGIYAQTIEPGVDENRQVLNAPEYPHV